MIRTSELHRMTAIDVDAAAKIGHVDEIYLDLTRHAIAALSIARGNVLSGEDDVVLAADAVTSIGEDAVMVHVPRRMTESVELLTRASNLAGRAIVTESGTHLGKLDDVLFDEESGRIVGYVFAERDDKPGIADFFNRRRDRDDPVVDYVRADANVKIGDLIVVPDSGVVRGHDLRDSYDPATHTSANVSAGQTISAPTQTVAPAGPSVVRPVNAPDTTHATRGTRLSPVDSTVAAPTTPTSRTTARTWRVTHTKWGQGAP